MTDDMKEFYSVCSQQRSAQAVIADTLAQLESAPKTANFGFIYATDAMSSKYSELLRQCKQVTGIEHWLGSLGLGVISTGKEHYDLPAVSILLADFDPQEFAMLPLISDEHQLAGGIKTPREFATHFGIIHGDPYNESIQELLTSLYDSLENGFLTGGLTSSQHDHLQVADEIYSGGISGAIFSENISVQTNLSQGCSPVGRKHVVTRSQENVAFTLDQNPALEVLMEAFDVATEEELQEISGGVFIGLCIPGSDRNDYLVRNLVGIDSKNQIFAINDYLHDGAEVIFCERNAQTAIDDMQQMLVSLKDRINQPIKGGLYVSCLGRGRQQFGEDSEEVKMIHEVLGDFPLTGFFANGEIHHDKLYGYTGVLTIFT